MMPFLIAAAVLVMAALALLSRPWWRRRRADGRSRRALNAAIYRDELSELDSDRASGQLNEADYEHARAELQRRLLEDAAESDAPVVATTSRGTLIGLIVALPLAAAGLYLWLGSPAALTQQPRAPAAANMTPADIDRMVATLAAKLESEPDNLQGWAMLARSYKVLHRPDQAIRAFEKAWPVVQQDPQLLADYADLLASNAGGDLTGKPEQLVNMALKLDPNHLQSLWLAGTAAFNHKDYGKAADLWQRALAQLPPQSEDAQMLTSVINEARSKQGVGKTASSAAAVSGRVELAANLKAKASPDDTVFILARGEDGPMPLAAIRARVADLPMDFRLDDSNAVMPTRTISSAKTVRIEARVSKAGDALTKPGDLSGSTGPVKPGAKNLRIKIDKIVQ